MRNGSVRWIFCDNFFIARKSRDRIILVLWHALSKGKNCFCSLFLGRVKGGQGSEGEILFTVA